MPIDPNDSFHTSGSDVYLPPSELKKEKPATIPVVIHEKATTLMHRITIAVRAVRFGKVDEIVDVVRRILHDEFLQDPDTVRQWLDTQPAETPKLKVTSRDLTGRKEWTR